MQQFETTNEERFGPGDWISWRRKSLDRRRFGKVIGSDGKLFVVCATKGQFNGGVYPDTWGLGDFEWAVAEGRVLADSIRTLQGKLKEHERNYINE